MHELTESRSEVVAALRASPLFGALDEAVLNDFARCVELQCVPGGSEVLREGDPSEFMIVVISGRLRVSRRDADGSLLLYNEICPGESVGEIGLILRQPRTANVTAVRDSTLAILHRANFEALLTLQPLAINRVFSQAIFDHLRHKPTLQGRRNAQSFAVIPLHPGAEAREVASGLAVAFSRLGRCHHVTLDAIRDMLDNRRSTKTVAERFDDLERQYDYLIYEGAVEASALTMRAFRQADQLVYVASGTARSEPGETERRLAAEPGFSMKRQHLALHYPAASLHQSGSDAWHRDRSLERVYGIRKDHGGDYAHFIRFLTGTAVGVVLGGGGARGFAHIGILRALQECGIPVDLVGGNSMGALIGAQYVSGVPLDEILARTRRFALGGERPTLPLVSLLAGRRIERDLRRMFGDTRIEALWRPYFAAACNLSRGCTTVQDHGLLWRAVLASNSPAGLLPPVLHEGQLLVDGAILDNVPVEAMRVRLGTPLEKRRGNGTVIAIDVDVRDDLMVDPALARLGPMHALGRYFRRSAPPVPGIGDILYRAGHIGSLHQRARTIMLADHYLEPQVGKYALMDYRRADEIADVGYRYALERIEQWDRKSMPR